MNLFPIAIREARLISRKRQLFNLRWIVGAVGLVFCLDPLFSLIPAAEKGPIIFMRLIFLCKCVALFGGVLYSCDGISRERREGTLRLLFLTPLKARDVLAGKFVASAAAPLATLLAILPLLTLPLLLGGVHPMLVVLAAIHLLNTLFFALALGFFVSSLFVNALAALAVAGGIAVVLAVIPFVFQQTTAAAFGAIPLLSPFILAAGIAGPVPISRVSFICSNIFTQVVAWTLLLLAARRAQKSSDGPATVRAEKRQRFLHGLRFGGTKQRARLRTKLLSQNPLAWIANREQISSAGLIAICFVLLAAPMLSPTMWDDNLLAGYLLAHLFVALKIAATSASQLAEDRNSGALELLLATPLTVRDILVGRGRALFRQFFGPGAVLLSLHLITAIFVFTFPPGNGADERPHVLAGFILYAVCAAALWWAIAWTGMWQGLRRRTLVAAALCTLLLTLAPLAGLYILAREVTEGMFWGNGLFAYFEYFFGNFAVESVWIYVGPSIAIAYLSRLFVSSRNKLRKHFREAAVSRHLNAS